MEQIAEFYKVDTNICGIPEENITLPKRATVGSAGYDFYATEDFTLNPGEGLLVNTGVRAKMEEGWVLLIFPRSGLGRKYKMRLDNTTGVIDSDYFYSENQGHIMVPITNCGEKAFSVKKGEAFCQGVFVKFGITSSDNTVNIRNGGFGSTDKK